MTADSNFNSMPHIRAPFPYFNAFSYNHPQAWSTPIPEGLPQTDPYWPTMRMPPQSPFHSGRPTTPSEDTLPDWAYSEFQAKPTSGCTEVSDNARIAESRYRQSLPNKCAGLHLPWKAGYSSTHRHLWTQTLTDALLDLLEGKRIQKRKSIDQNGVHRFAQIVEDAIFNYMGLDPAEYGDLMAAKYDAMRCGDFLYEERRLLQYSAWL